MDWFLYDRNLRHERVTLLRRLYYLCLNMLQKTCYPTLTLNFLEEVRFIFPYY